MSCRNIDCWAVACITAMLLAFSWADSLRIDRVVGPVQVRTAVNGSNPCPISETVSSLVSDFLNQ